jgi:hypothetical protein
MTGELTCLIQSASFDRLDQASELLVRLMDQPSEPHQSGAGFRVVFSQLSARCSFKI